MPPPSSAFTISQSPTAQLSRSTGARPSAPTAADQVSVDGSFTATGAINTNGTVNCTSGSSITAKMAPCAVPARRAPGAGTFRRSTRHLPHRHGSDHNRPLLHGIIVPAASLAARYIQLSTDDQRRCHARRRRLHPHAGHIGATWCYGQYGPRLHGWRTPVPDRWHRHLRQRLHDSITPLTAAQSLTATNSTSSLAGCVVVAERAPTTNTATLGGTSPRRRYSLCSKSNCRPE